jgi:hypothetical protein
VTILKGLLSGLGLALAVAVLAPVPEVSAQDCRRCARQSTIAKCVRCSLNSPQAKQKGYSESGIRRWCELNQPACFRPGRNR